MSGLILIVAGETSRWSSAVVSSARRAGYVTVSFDDIESGLAYTSVKPVRALFLDARHLSYGMAEALRTYREDSPETTVVVVGQESASADLKLALEGGASAFLSWPATDATLRRLLRATSVRPRGKSSARPAAAPTGGSTA